MIDPLLSLAFSVYSSKGVYALLLGSGVSRSAGVPTGWEITQDLISKLAHLEGVAPTSLDSWYREKYESDPDYSKLLGELAASPAERLKLLQAYFEPTEDERREGIKSPTAAHRAIADLTANGYLRVIVTTNFDRLLEQAMVDVGIQPSVISNAHTAAGAMPLTHSRCTLIKVNGDYLDPRFRNTEAELSAYEPAVDRVLDQVLDEYGLIVSGWSGDWDAALRAAIERCPSCRFTTFWASRGKTSERTERLIENRRAVKLSISNADTFFPELRDRIVALENYGANDPLSPKIAVARIKRYLTDPRSSIALHDLVTEEVAAVKERTNGAQFQSANENASAQTMLARLKRYDVSLDLLLSELLCLGYWANSDHQGLLIQCFRRVGEEQDEPEPGMNVWLNLRRYPALVLLYGIGIAAIAHGNYYHLKSLFDLKLLKSDHSGEKRIGVRLNDNAVIQRGDAQKQLLDRNEHTPLSNYLFDRLKQPLKEYLPAEHEYDRAFTWFEYFSCLASLDARLSLSEAKSLAEDEKSNMHAYWIPVNRIGWNKFDLAAVVEQELPKAIEAGFFGGNTKQAEAKFPFLMTLAARLINRVREEWRIW